MNKIVIIIVVIIAFNYSSCNSQNRNVKVSAILDDCVLRLDFENLSNDEQLIPNYYAMAVDTFQGMLVMPVKIIRINKDTIVLSSYHVRTFEGGQDTLAKHDISVSHMGEKSKINLVSNKVVLKKNNTQILRMPNAFCSNNYLYCSIYLDGELISQSEIRKRGCQITHQRR